MLEMGTKVSMCRITCSCSRGRFKGHFYDVHGRLTEKVDMVPGGMVLNIEKC